MCIKACPRVRKFIDKVKKQQQKIQDMLTWKDPFTSFCALILSSVIIWNFEVWMLPFSLVLFFTFSITTHAKNDGVLLKSSQSMNEEAVTDEIPANEEEEETFTVMEAWGKLQQGILWIQEGLGNIANRLESLQNECHDKSKYGH